MPFIVPCDLDFSFNNSLSVQFTRSVMSDSLQPPGVQHTRSPCLSPTPGFYLNSYPLSRWCHPIISSSVIPFSSCPQSFPASGSFQISQFFTSGGQSIGVSASSENSGLISFRIDWLDLYEVQGTLKSLLQHHSSKASILQHSAFFIFQLSHLYMTTRKTTSLTRQTFVGKVISLLFNMLFKLVITFLPRSKHLLISCCSHHLQWFLEPPKIKSVAVSTVSPSICHEVMEPDAMTLVFWMLSFKPTFSLSSFKRLFNSSLLSAIRAIYLHVWGYWYFSWQSWFQLVLLQVQHFSWCTLHIS